MSNKPFVHAAVKPMGLAGQLLALLQRECLVTVRRRSELLNPLIFFVLVCSLFPLGLGPEAEVLSALAPGILWTVALLASMLSAEAVFRSDYDDGSLEQILVSPLSLYWLSLAKCLAYWLLTGLPLALLSPVLAAMMQLPALGIPALMASLLLGSLVLCCIGAIGAALTVGLRRGSMLLALLVLPLYVPVLIFGSAAVQSAVAGEAYAGPLAMIGAMALLSLAFAPMAVAGGLRISADQ